MSEGNANLYEWKDFVPDLIDGCTKIIAGICQSETVDFHALWWTPPNMKTMTMIVQIDGTRELHKLYNRAWRKRTRVQAGIKICAILMAVEILDTGLFGWAGADQTAHAAAKRLMGEADTDTRTRMLTVFRVIDNEDMGAEWRDAVADLLVVPPQATSQVEHQSRQRVKGGPAHRVDRWYS